MERTRELKASGWCSQARKKGLHASDEMTGVDKNGGVVVLATKWAREERSTGARRNDTPATGATNTHEC